VREETDWWDGEGEGRMVFCLGINNLLGFLGSLHGLESSGRVSH
jgi:hypothetical protein